MTETSLTHDMLGLTTIFGHRPHAHELAGDDRRKNPASTESGSPERRTAEQVDAHRILICEDQKDTAEGLATLLQLDGYEVRVAYDGASAIAEARQWRPTAAIIDIGLPGITGYAVAQSIRALPDGGDVLLIAVTGYGSAADIAMARYAGFDWHFAKPAHPSFIAEALKHPSRDRIHRRDGVPLKRGDD